MEIQKVNIPVYSADGKMRVMVKASSRREARKMAKAYHQHEWELVK